MRILITGGAGCIGSDLAEALLDRGHEILLYDNFSSGKREHVDPLLERGHCRLIEADMMNRAALCDAVRKTDMVYHLAANPDIKFIDGARTDKDLEQNTLATYYLLEEMRLARVRSLAFASTSAVYGIQQKLPIPEDAPCQPVSLYGASKLAGEALISSFAHLFGMRAWVFRFANIVGPKVRKKGGTVIGDFIGKLRSNAAELEILGDGKQAKSYLTSRECVVAMLHAVDHAPGPVDVLNLGGNDWLSVERIAEMVAGALGLTDVRFLYTGGEGGWPGDVPRFRLDVAKINALGWKAKLNSEQSVGKAIRAILEQGA